MGTLLFFPFARRTTLYKVHGSFGLFPAPSFHGNDPVVSSRQNFHPRTSTAESNVCAGFQPSTPNHQFHLSATVGTVSIGHLPSLCQCASLLQPDSLSSNSIYLSSFHFSVSLGTASIEHLSLLYQCRALLYAEHLSQFLSFAIFTYEVLCQTVVTFIDFVSTNRNPIFTPGTKLLDDNYGSSITDFFLGGSLDVYTRTTPW